MERINERRSLHTWGNRKKKKSSIETAHSGSRAQSTQQTQRESAFSNQLSDKVDPLQSEAMSVLLADGSIDVLAVQNLQDAIHSIGSKLLKNPRIDIALEYKAAIGRLLKSVVPHIHKKEVMVVKKGIKTPNGYDIKEYKFVLVSKINKKLDDVLKLVAGTQVDQMKLMKSLDEIKGLIVNLLQ